MFMDTQPFKPLPSLGAGSVDPRSGKGESAPVRRVSKKGVAGILALAGVAGTVGLLANSSSANNQQRTEEALLAQPRTTVLSEIGQGMLDPTKLTEVTVPATEYADSAMTGIEGDAVDHTVGSHIAEIQTGGNENNTTLQADSQIIMPLNLVKGNPPNLVQQVQRSEQFGK
jgi:hypothetical protein